LLVFLLKTMVRAVNKTIADVSERIINECSGVTCRATGDGVGFGVVTGGLLVGALASHRARKRARHFGK
jgi:hypothetical protein